MLTAYRRIRAGDFPLGQNHFALGQDERMKATDRRMRRIGRGSRIRLAYSSPLADGNSGRNVGGPAEAPTIRHRLSFMLQQSLSAAFLSALAPSACCAAV